MGGEWGMCVQVRPVCCAPLIVNILPHAAIFVGRDRTLMLSLRRSRLTHLATMRCVVTFSLWLSYLYLSVHVQNSLSHTLVNRGIWLKPGNGTDKLS